MQKIVPILVVGILIISGIGAVAITDDSNSDLTKIELEEKFNFSQPEIKEYNKDSLIVTLEGDELYLMSPGKPMVPKVTNQIELPFGVKNVIVELIPKDIIETKISKEILFVPIPIPLTSKENQVVTNYEKDYNIYSSEELYPNDWFSYNIGCGLNREMERVTHLTINIYPIRYSPASNLIYSIEQADLRISFEQPDNIPFPKTSEYDMVIIAPSDFSSDLNDLIDHKNSFGISTTLKTTEEIYSEYQGLDKPEQIKYFIKDAIESWNVKYVLLVGGLKSLYYAKPKDDTNHGSSGWHLPVRYSNLGINAGGEPGYICDLYYADIYMEGGMFDDWDSNDNGIFAEWSTFVAGKDEIDYYPDVALGRLACRNNKEVQDVVTKIINYEETPSDPSWFNRIIGVTGDGFLDQETLGIQWDTNGLPNGEYTIYAQSNNDENEYGPIDQVVIEIDKSLESKITFNHDDHLQIENFPNYPAPPIAEIVSVSNGDILGNTDYSYMPSEGEAYINRGWARVSYNSEVLTINGKSYDPKLYGNVTNIHVWIKNSNNEIIFDAWRNNTLQFSEGDWTVGEKVIHGRGGAFHYMPEDFEKIMISTANGEWETMDDVMNAISQGSGFLFFSGHGSPNVFANHFPGVPGNRHNGDTTGLKVSQITMFPPFISSPLFPMDELTNNNKLPVTVVGGCHNSMFNVSAIPAMMHFFYYMGLMKDNWMFTYGQWVPETYSWYIVKLPETGAIASIGNTGYGYGILGEWCTSEGLDNWITTEFFRQYSVEDQGVLGDAHSQSVANYIDTFGKTDSGHVKTFQQWVLLGDPSLHMGGFIR